MDFKSRITEISIGHYKLVTLLMVIFTLVCGALMPMIRVDTDPENMLSADEIVRIFHNQTKDEFNLSDIVVLGIVNNEHPEGVFNVDSLTKIYELTEFAKTLTWLDDEGNTAGVIDVDIISPSVIDHISQAGPGNIRFEWLMPKPPSTEQEALDVKDKVMSNPMLKGTLVSEDGKAICLYLPLTDKHLSYRVYSSLQDKIKDYTGNDNFYITGLPVAEDTFGVEMFIQMAISAPLAMVVIFILMLLFFKKLVLVISPMIIAMVSVITTMGLLIGFGFPVHIMSSMIPIFLMPIAVVDSVHILSEFFDMYTPQKGRTETIRQVMGQLFVPMLYTSLTSAAGFASLALTPIPPVQVFGIFVATGIMFAWLATVTFVPAYIMMIPEKSLANFGHAAHTEDKPSVMANMLQKAGMVTYKYAKLILVVIIVLCGIAAYGITKIQINDNPVKWFSKNHPIRVADHELNQHFGGTYMAYLVLSDSKQSSGSINSESIIVNIEKAAEKLKEDYPKAAEAAQTVKRWISQDKNKFKTAEEMLGKFSEQAGQLSKESQDNDLSDAWYELAAVLDREKERLKIFKQPEILEYISDLQEYLEKTGLVGKSNSVAGVVKKVYQELTDGSEANYKIPENSGAVAECLIQFQNSHRPHDLWHLVNSDYSKANLWLQLPSGDNKDMEHVVKAVDKYFNANKAPADIEYNWAGLTYINIVWQDKMVWGMLQSFLGSFLIVFIMMTVLFRSPLWGLICMIPLTITILVIYGIIGLMGKDYDMPVAVLSALTLGMAVDFAIHFLERARSTYAEKGSWKESSAEMFGEPARAITRNVLVIAIGFLPLLAAPLIPYKTVGVFLCAIMGLSGAVTLLVLPSILSLAEKHLFKPAGQPMSTGCNCGLCLTVSTSAIVLILLNVHQYWQVNLNTLMVLSAVSIPVTVLLCGRMSRRKVCKTQGIENNESEN